ncbi:4a-hydroxytetrahydrobiopterin dehydratase [Arthrobacter sp. SA17]
MPEPVVPEKAAVLTRPQIDEALAGLPDWRYRLGGLVTVFKLPTAAKALDLIAAVGRLAEEQDHHPDLDWRFNRVFIRFTSHDAGSEVTRRDITAAASVSAEAEAAGATAEPGLYRTIEIAIDSADPAEISEVWRVALGYKKGRYGDLVDPHGRGRASGSRRRRHPVRTGFTWISTGASRSPNLLWRRPRVQAP